MLHFDKEDIRHYNGEGAGKHDNVREKVNIRVEDNCVHVVKENTGYSPQTTEEKVSKKVHFVDITGVHVDGKEINHKGEYLKLIHQNEGKGAHLLANQLLFVYRTQEEIVLLLEKNIRK